MKKQEIVLLGLVILGLSLVLPVKAAQAIPLNGDFSSDLSGWTASGPVTVQTGTAVLGDQGGGSSLLQMVGLPAGEYLLEFDFLNELAESEPSDDFFSFPDVFFASLYFTDSAVFDLLSPPLPGNALFDLDYSGPYNTVGLISPSAKGGQWQHFSFSFTNLSLYAVPVFELLDLDFEDGNSLVRLDNISITGDASEIPEPGALLLLSSSMVFFAIRKVRAL